MELIPRFHWIKGLASNIYLWIGPNNHVLVDTGMPQDNKKIRRYLDEHGANIQDISTILITHADYDHAGSAARLQAASGARVVAGEKTAELLKLGESPHHTPPLFQRLVDMVHYPAVPEESLEIIGSREFIEGLEDWQAIATPGHSDDHYSFYVHGDGLLFTGDALFARGQLDLGRPFMTGDRVEARKSAINLLKLTPAVFCCGHGPPIMNHLADDIMLLSKRLQPQ